MIKDDLQPNKQALATFCQRWQIARLSIYGSLLGDDFGPQSDVDLLVEFEPEFIPSLLEMAQMELELSPLFQGRKIDLRTAEDLSSYFRQDVLSQAEIQYAKTG